MNYKGSQVEVRIQQVLGQYDYWLKIRTPTLGSCISEFQFTERDVHSWASYASPDLAQKAGVQFARYFIDNR